MDRRVARRRKAAIRAGSSGYKRKAKPRSYQVKNEKKGMDTNLALSPVIDTTSTNASSFVVNLVRAGNGYYNRVGRKISMQSLRIRGMATYVYRNAAATGTLNGGTLRMVVVYDKSNAASIPTFDSIFGNTTQDGTESTDDLDAPRLDVADRYRVLKDCVWVVNPSTQNTAGGSANEVNDKLYFDEFIKLNGLITSFDGDSSPMTISDINTGAIYIYFRANANTASVAQFSIAGNSTSRLRYYD